MVSTVFRTADASLVSHCQFSLIVNAFAAYLMVLVNCPLTKRSLKPDISSMFAEMGNW
ncbi:MAG: hypothetical protein KME46_09085 [Brasilonema angustatum HA4187-MV1]|nr:hypothetical protein [Brasilonema angustatum HA4187-MV1]